jgi:dihydrofolate reductase
LSPAARKRPELVVIAAVARGGVIGRDNALPWHLPADLQHFKRTTLGAPVIMGRRTWESLPPHFRPLPGRRNVVITSHARWHADGAQAVPSLEQALDMLADAPRVFVIGGAALYASALPVADELVLTEIDADFDGDAHFPAWDRSAFAEVSRESHPAEPPHTPGFAFVTYRRRPR